MGAGLSISSLRIPLWQTLGAGIAVVVLSVSSGTLECNPLFETREVAHGHEIYGRMCAVCHGVNGEGYKADQAPALANASFLSSVSDPFLIAAITHGRAGSTMSAWGVEHSGPLAKPDVLAVVQYLRTWQPSATASLNEKTIEGDLTRGTGLYAQRCAQCHGAHGTGGPMLSIGNPQLLSTAGNGFLRYAVDNGRPGTQMPAFGTSLGAQGVEDVLALLRMWQTGAPAAARPPPLPLGPVPLNPGGPEPIGFDGPGTFTKADVIKAQLDRGAKMGILDARAPSDYTGDHIVGSVSVPFYDPEPYIAGLPKDAWLVCYCGCPHAESGQLAQKLKAKGFKKVTVLDEGLRYWVAKKYGTHSGMLP